MKTSSLPSLAAPWRRLLRTTVPFVLSAIPALAAPLYWDGSGTGWDSVTSWSTAADATTPDPAAVPGSTDDVVFNISTLNTPVTASLNADRLVQSLLFNNTGTTLLQGGGTNRTLTLGTGGLTIDAAAGAVTIGSSTTGQNVAVTLGASQAWTNNSGTTFTVVNNVTSAASTTATLTVAGSGNTTLSGTLNDGTSATLGLTKTGTGYLRLAGGATDILGAVSIQGGTIGATSDFTATGLTGTGTFENGTANDKWSFWNITTDQTFDGIIRNSDGSTAGLLGLVKRGTGKWTLTNNGNNATSNLTVEAGTLVLNNTGTYGSTLQASAVRTGFTASVGSTAATNGVLVINGANVNYNNRSGSATQEEVYRGTLNIGANATGAGAVKMQAGSLTTYRQLAPGAVNGSYGAFVQTGGTTTVNGFLALGLGATARGVMDISAGTYNQAGPVTNGATGSGVIRLSGTADFEQTSTGDNGLWVGESGTGLLNVHDSAVLNIASGNNGLQLGRNAAGVGVVNLFGGTVTAKAVYKGAGSGRLNFDGGKLVANGDNTAFLTGLTAANVRPGGGTIDNGGYAITIGQPLLAATGMGVSATGLSVSGGGYIAAPLVSITGGSGTGATGVASIDASGNLTGITITSAGSGYTASDTVAVALLGGGIGNTGAVTGAPTLVANTSGGMTFAGGGATTLAGVSTYTGNTTVSGGTLVLAQGGGLRFKAGATGVSNKLSGSGTVTINGAFSFDLSGASTTEGDSWQIIDASALGVTYGDTFSITGFIGTDHVWIGSVGATYYKYTEATHTLEVTSPPGSFPSPTVSIDPIGSAYAVSATITLHAQATGVGTLTYQWSHDGTAITDATSDTLTLSNVQLADAGSYAVVVTDHAAEAYGQTATTGNASVTVNIQTVANLALAYYRFEAGSAGASLLSAVDSSPAGTNALTTTGTLTYASDVPYSIVPATGASNTLSSSYPTSGSNYLIGASDAPVATTNIDSFTVEAFVKFTASGAFQTIVGRNDDGNPGLGSGPQSLLYFQRNNANLFRIEVITKSNTDISVAATTASVEGRWYHVAAVGDATAGTLTLYVDGVSVGSVTGFDGLFRPTSGSNTPWTVGCGQYNGNQVDFLRGNIDEVRITSVALQPSQFLNAGTSGPVVPPVITTTPLNQTVRTGADATFTVAATGTGTLTYQWYQDGTLISGATDAVLSLTHVTTSAEGTYSVIVTDSAGEAAGVPLTVSTSAVLRVLNVPDVSRAISLNFVGASSGNATYATDLGTMLTADAAGFVPAANWVNSATATGIANSTTPLALVENTGAATISTATWTAANTWAARVVVGVASAKTPDLRLFHGYIESRASTGSTVSFADIPYGTYDVYVYFAGGTANNVGVVSLNRDGVSPQYHRLAYPDSYVSTGEPAMIGDSVDAATAATAPRATFVRFAGITGQQLTISAADAVLNANAGGIAAVEIVDRTPAGSYPPVVSTSPASQFAVGGTTVNLSAAATSANGGTISYKWQKDGVDISGATSATLTLANVTGTDSASYTVVITDSVGSVTTTRSASVVVLDATRPLLINADLNAGSGDTMTGQGILRTTGTVNDGSGIGEGSDVWNGLTAAAGAATRIVAKESTGLSLPNVTFAFSGAGGAEDNDSPNKGAIRTPSEAEYVTSGAPLLRDYLYTDSQTVPITATVGGLQAFAGHKVTLVVYAIGKNSRYSDVDLFNDGATVTLAGGSNYDPTNNPPYVTDQNKEGRDLGYNNEANAPGTAAYATFVGVVGSDGTVVWTLGPDADNGTGTGEARIALNGFQLLVDDQVLVIAPSITTQPTGATRLQGLSYTFSAGVVGSPAPSLQWQKSADGVSGWTDISGATGTSYAIASLAPADTASYRVVATSGATTINSDPAALVVQSTTPTGARGIGINWKRDAQATSTMAATDYAGVVPQGYWDNRTPSATTFGNLVDSTGEATAVAASLSSGGSWYAFSPDTTQPTQKLYQGYWDIAPGSSAAGTTATATVSGITYTSYDVYVYFASDRAEGVSTASIAFNGASPVYGKAMGTALATALPLYLAETTEASPTSPPLANYVKATGLSGSSFTVTATKVDNNYGIVGIQIVNTGTVALAAPATLSATAGDTQASLSWAAVSGATSYNVYRGTASGTYTRIATGVTTTTYVDTGLTNGTTYYYAVKTVNEAGASDSYSVEASATPASSATALQLWRQTYFSTIDNSGDAANTADPDGDGLTNLMEYALGTSPVSTTTSPVVLDEAGGFLTLTFPHGADSTLVYSVEAANDVAGTWTTVQTYPAFTATGTTTYTDTVAIGSQSRRFLRLRVTAP